MNHPARSLRTAAWFARVGRDTVAVAQQCASAIRTPRNRELVPRCKVPPAYTKTLDRNDWISLREMTKEKTAISLRFRFGLVIQLRLHMQSPFMKTHFAMFFEKLV